MINQIEDAIVARIKNKLATIAGKVAVQKGVEGIPQPAVYVSTEGGRFEKVTMASCRHQLAVYVDIVFSYRGADERERRKGIYLILLGVVQELFMETLGLAIKPIMPKDWRNTTVEELRTQGLLTFSLELTTSYMITKLNAEEAADLLAVGLNYYLKPGDDEVDAVDIVTVPDI